MSKPLQLDIAEPVWLRVAREYDGLCETIAGKPNPQVAEFFQATKFKGGTSKDAWCSAFMCHVFEQCKLHHPRSARARDWLEHGTRLLRPRVGCITVFRRPDPKDKPTSLKTYARGLHHVTLWTKDEGSWQLCYGGNQNNRVCLKPYPTADLIAWIWPKQQAED
jgi:uncharacterized protein (TIGR02594 family)